MSLPARRCRLILGLTRPTAINEQVAFPAPRRVGSSTFVLGGV